MFIVVLIMCTISGNNNRIECKSIIPNGQFYTRRECELSTREKYHTEDFECVRMPVPKVKW